jgi:NTE family protein
MKVKLVIMGGFVAVAALSGAMAAEPVGLVLSGGGAKGAYEVGVWKALCEAGVADRITVFSGTSVGAINAALLASVRDPDKCARIWREEVSGVFVPDANLKWAIFCEIFKNAGSAMCKRKQGKESGERLSLWDGSVILAETSASIGVKAVKKIIDSVHGPSNSVGVCDSSGLRDALRRHLPERWETVSPLVYATAVAKEQGGAHLFCLNGNERERDIDYVMASAAIPIGYGSVEIDGVPYVDGGFEAHGGDNTPVKAVVEKHPEVKTMIVVYLKDRTHLKRRVSQGDLPGVNLIEIIPSKDIEGRFGFLGLIDSSPKAVEFLLNLGYSDAKRVLKRCAEILGTQKQNFPKTQQQKKGKTK